MLIPPPPPPMAASSSGALSLFQSLNRFLKAPWEITGPCADPEYRTALPKVTEYRRFSPATAPVKVCVPFRCTVLKKADVEKMMAEKTFGPADFPPVHPHRACPRGQERQGRRVPVIGQGTLLFSPDFN